MKYLITVLFTLLINTCIGQTEHNFTKGPENTNCDSLQTEGVIDLIKLVRNSTFRLTEQLKISRYKSPRHVWFYSCDGKTGYLIAKETEDKEIIIPEVKKEDWDEHINSKDPIGSYLKLKSIYNQD